MEVVHRILKEQLTRIFESYKNQYGIIAISIYSQSASGKALPPTIQLGNVNPAALKLPGQTSLTPYRFFAFDQIDDPKCKQVLEQCGATHAAVQIEDKDTYYLIAFYMSEQDLPDTVRAGMELITEDITRIIQNTLLDQELKQFSSRMEQMVAEMGAIHEIGRAFESSGNSDHLLREILQKCQILMHAEAASLMLLDEPANELEFRVVLGPKSDEVKPLRLPVGKGIAGWVAEKGEPLLIPDAYEDERFNPSFDKQSGYRTKSILSVPMIHKSKVIGVVNVLNRVDGDPFCDSDKTFLTTFASQAALAIENARLLQSTIEKEGMERELKVAGEIQQLLIPQALPEVTGLDLSAIYIPCKEVSGDFYDIIRLNDKRYVFVVADVAGKGVPAALMVSMMQASLLVYLEHSQDLLYIIHKLNELLIRHTAQDRFITCFLGIYDNRDRTLTYVNAGHNPPLLFNNNNTMRVLDTGGLFIGSMPWQYEEETVELEKDNVLCLFTDGLFEITNDQLEQFGLERMTNILYQHRSGSAKQIQEKVIEAARKHIGTKKMDDDLTLIVLKKT